MLQASKVTNYRDQGKREKQAALMPELVETIRKAKEALAGGVKYPSWASRKTQSFYD